MSTTVVIGGSPVGEGYPTVVISELGINHGGNIDTAKKMIDASIEAGANIAKTQKRTIEVVYSLEELSRPRESPFGTTNEALKRGLELGRKEYDELNTYCKARNFSWFASCWDEASVDFIAQYDPPAFKIASACLTDDNLLRCHRQYKKPIVLSTGMSTLEQIDHAVEILGTDDLVILHCTSNYPAKSEHLNLSVIETLRLRYNLPTGYSGHELGLATTVAAVAMGAVMIERHICLNRADWGSDMSASVEPQGFKRMVRDLREVERARGDGIKRVLSEEVEVMKKLRRVNRNSI